jgi:putative acetyltransferase
VPLTFGLIPSEVAHGSGAFLVAFREGVAFGCGALRCIDTLTGELKRMYVNPSARGLGVGHALLVALQAEARRLGLTRVVLETGVRQAPALSLYERAGFTRIALFGEYVGSPLSVCMAKDL